MTKLKASGGVGEGICPKSHSYLAGGLGPEPEISMMQDEKLAMLSHLSRAHAEGLSGV